MTEPLLKIEDLDVGYGEGVVIHGLTLTIEAGGSLAVLGRNGAGKSTLMLAIAGHLAPRTGRIRFNGQDITAMSPHRRCRLGIGWVPQGREVFAPLSVEENLRIAATPGACGCDWGSAPSSWRSSSSRSAPRTSSRRTRRPAPSRSSSPGSS